jgi:hypothetical protein
MYDMYIFTLDTQKYIYSNWNGHKDKRTKYNLTEDQTPIREWIQQRMVLLK